jgi:hypothetical protein
LGTSTGYAAFPDPGGLVISAPGLVAGLLQSPISPPQYPLFVSSDATTNPSAAVGAGPYSLRAVSQPASSRASALAGLSSGITGNVGKVAASAMIVSTAGRVVTSSVTDVEGITIGPLTIGQVRSSAQIVRDRDGTRTPTTDLELSALKVANIPIQLTPDGLNLANSTTVPLPVGAVASKLLKARHITVKVLSVKANRGKIVSPALQIRFPSEVPDLGTAVVTMVIGYSVVSLSSSSPPTIGNGSGTIINPAGAGTTVGGPGDLGGADGTTNVPGGLVDTGGTSAIGGPAGGGVPPVTAGDQTRTAYRIPPQLSFDLSSFYLVCALAFGVVFVMSQLIRLVGVRSRWKS